MRTAKQKIHPCPISWQPVEKTPEFAELGKLKDGKLGQELMKAVDSGLSDEEFDAWKSAHRKYHLALAALQRQNPKLTEGTLRTFARMKRLFRLYADELDWQLLSRAYPCLGKRENDKEQCPGCCGQTLYSVVQDILEREDRRRQPGGVWADRLELAMALGVPAAKIRLCRLIHVPTALKILGKPVDYLRTYEKERLEREAAKKTNEHI